MRARERRRHGRATVFRSPGSYGGGRRTQHRAGPPYNLGEGDRLGSMSQGPGDHLCGTGCPTGHYCQGRHLDAPICRAAGRSRARPAQFYPAGPGSPSTRSCSRTASTIRKDLSVTSVSLASLEMPHRPQPLPAGPAPAHTSTLPEGQSPLGI